MFAIARRRLADYRRTAVRRRTDVVDVAAFDSHHAHDSPENEALDKLSGQRAATLITSVLSGEQAEVLLLRVLAEPALAVMAHPTRRSALDEFRIHRAAHAPCHKRREARLLVTRPHHAPCVCSVNIRRRERSSLRADQS